MQNVENDENFEDSELESLNRLKVSCVVQENLLQSSNLTHKEAEIGRNCKLLMRDDFCRKRL